MFDKFFGRFSKDLGIDLGTTNIRIYVRDKGIVINEPSVVAVNIKTEQILAVGNEAREMVGKTPPHIITARPLGNSIIADFEITEKLLKYFIDKVHAEGFTMVPRPRVVVGAPLEITEVERKAVEDAVLSAGAREVHIVETPMSAAIGGRLPIEEPTGSMIVDLGGGTSQVAVISLSGIVTRQSIPIGGEELNKNIVQYCRDVFNLLIGERHAERIKMEIGSAVVPSESASVNIRGRDLLSGLPKEITVTDSHVREATGRSLRAIVEQIKLALEVTPPELVSDIHERGMVLTGGGALLRGMSALIASATDIPVRIADDPLTCMVRGAGYLLENPELLKEIEVPFERE
ncbi:MAG: rod shape-determining protein MreB, rod shape-determining protein MreB-related protein [Candidatus Magasanikbacteria bacterium]|nr:rod shape-determining protein MreB, rod shape-determining protein MreB-related protein [Candidatus Magasanikbacteria bacterium]